MFAQKNVAGGSVSKLLKSWEKLSKQGAKAEFPCVF